jgi:SAM-dependent methyltransferase
MTMRSLSELREAVGSVPGHVRFWGKSVLYRIVPGGVGYYRRLTRYRDPGYVHERDRPPVRAKHQAGKGWQTSTSAVTYRDYASYDEYLAHQRSKFDEILKLRGGFSNRDIWHYRLRFYDRFKFLPRVLPSSAQIVCLGARQGTEVEVLRDLGFVHAYGLDLNPGPDNPYVRAGDFLHLAEATSSVDMVYSNAVDHAFDLEAFFAEHARVITPEGYALYDLFLGDDAAGAFESVHFADDRAVILTMLKYFKTIAQIANDGRWKWILLKGKVSDPPRS